VLLAARALRDAAGCDGAGDDPAVQALASEVLAVAPEGMAGRADVAAILGVVD
jgi:hypothetical protein